MDQSILLAFYSFTSGNSALSALAIFFAKWFPYLLLLAAVIYTFIRRTDQGIVRSFLLVFSPTIAAWLSAETIKFFLPLERPFAALNLTPLVWGENPLASFPSTHATFFATLGVTIFLRDKRIGKWFLLGALLVGLSRIAVGIHWPSDIVAGLLLGDAVAVIAHHILVKYSK